MEEAPGKPFYILHYTYGMDYTLEGVCSVLVWFFGCVVIARQALLQSCITTPMAWIKR